MSQIKLSCNNCFWSGYVCDYHICSNFVNCDDILKDINYQLFVDNDLSHDQRMFILNNRATIEGRFIDIINDRICNLKLDDNIRQVYLNNVNNFSRDLIHVHSNTNINFFDLGNDEEDDVDYLIDDPNLVNYDNHDDLENMLMDDYEFEHYFNVYRNNVVNEDENDINNDDNYGCSSTCRCVEFHPNSDFHDHD